LMHGQYMRIEVEKLRKDCGNIRFELEHHRSSHGC
jgi:hypothetical protein